MEIINTNINTIINMIYRYYRYIFIIVFNYKYNYTDTNTIIKIINTIIKQTTVPLRGNH